MELVWIWKSRSNSFRTSAKILCQLRKHDNNYHNISRRQKAEHDMTRSEAALLVSVREKEATLVDVRLTFATVTYQVILVASNPPRRLV